MTPKEKAEDLLLHYLEVDYKANDWSEKKHLAKQCALIAVEELINETDWCDDYWQLVKEEIEKL